VSAASFVLVHKVALHAMGLLLQTLGLNCLPRKALNSSKYFPLPQIPRKPWNLNQKIERNQIRPLPSRAGMN
jgi:hypothetical protein